MGGREREGDMEGERAVGSIFFVYYESIKKTRKKIWESGSHTSDEDGVHCGLDTSPFIKSMTHTPSLPFITHVGIYNCEHVACFRRRA